MNSKCRRLKRNIKEMSVQKFKDTKDIDLVLLDRNVDSLQQELKKEMDRINGR